MSPPVACGDDSRRLFACARALVAVDQRAHAASARERGDGRATLEIVPLVLVEGPENFGRLETPDLTPNASASPHESGEASKRQECANHVALRHECGPPGEEPL